MLVYSTIRIHTHTCSHALFELLSRQIRLFVRVYCIRHVAFYWEKVKNEKARERKRERVCVKYISLLLYPTSLVVQKCVKFVCTYATPSRKLREIDTPFIMACLSVCPSWHTVFNGRSSFYI